MPKLGLDELTAALENTRVTASGVSFAGKSMKLNSADDAKAIIEAIDDCENLQFLNLEGNTLGVDASEAIAKSLEKHSEFKRALWKDMFTGRMKTEIPKALELLGNGLVTAGARLVELDLSDNAFGPIGVEGLASLLRSSSCYALEELHLNNNGLGIGGGKLLAKALLDCYNCSKECGKPLSLKVFIAGRNRLENDGAKALAEVFKTIGTLEEIAMPQNGIYHNGISALSEAFKSNKNLEILNLNDNTVGPEGSKAIAEVLPFLKNLREINFGDCLLKTDGAEYLATGLQSCMEIEQLTLGFNEIRYKGAKALIKTLSNKSKLKSLNLDGNEFGNQGRIEVKNLMKEIGKLNALGSLSEDVSGESDSNEEDEETNIEGESGDLVKIELVEEEAGQFVKSDEPILGEVISNKSGLTVTDFLSSPNDGNFLSLGDGRTDLLLKEIAKNSDTYLDNFIKTLMKVSALTVSKDSHVVDLSTKCSEQLYRELFAWAKKYENLSIMNNSLLVHLALIKCEDKKFKPSWNIEGCLLALGNVLKKNYVPESTKYTMKLFIQREVDNKKEYLKAKKDILTILS